MNVSIGEKAVFCCLFNDPIPGDYIFWRVNGNNTDKYVNITSVVQEIPQQNNETLISALEFNVSQTVAEQWDNSNVSCCALREKNNEVISSEPKLLLIQGNSFLAMSVQCRKFFLVCI